MANKRNSNSLSSTTHFRRMREAIECIAEYEKINIHNYNLYHLACYRADGKDLCGAHVTSNVINECSCWVRGNNYSVYEAPSKNNISGSISGKFLVLAYNEDYDYYILAEMNHHIDEKLTKKLQQLIECVYYKIYGQYNKISERFSKNIIGEDVDLGGSAYCAHEFDSMGVRKSEGYSITTEKLLLKILKENTGRTLIDKKSVKIYKKHKKK